MIMIILIDF